MEPAHSPARQGFAEQLEQLQAELAREKERASNPEQLLVTVQLGAGADGDAGPGTAQTDLWCSSFSGCTRSGAGPRPRQLIFMRLTN